MTSGNADTLQQGGPLPTLPTLCVQEASPPKAPKPPVRQRLHMKQDDDKSVDQDEEMDELEEKEEKKEKKKEKQVNYFMAYGTVRAIVLSIDYC